MNIRSFSGRSAENVRYWIRHVDAMSILNRYTDEEKVAVACSSLMGSAAAWLNCQPHELWSWRDFEAEVLQEFFPDFRETVQALFHLRQEPSEDIWSYYERFGEHVALCEQVDPAQKQLPHALSVKVFIEGLADPLVQRKVKARRPHDLRAAADEAQYFVRQQWSEADIADRGGQAFHPFGYQQDLYPRKVPQSRQLHRPATPPQSPRHRNHPRRVSYPQSASSSMRRHPATIWQRYAEIEATFAAINDNHCDPRVRSLRHDLAELQADLADGMPRAPYGDPADDDQYLPDIHVSSHDQCWPEDYCQEVTYEAAVEGGLHDVYAEKFHHDANLKLQRNLPYPQHSGLVDEGLSCDDAVASQHDQSEDEDAICDDPEKWLVICEDVDCDCEHDMPASHFDEREDGDAIGDPPEDCLEGSEDCEGIGVNGQLSCHQAVDADNMHDAPELSAHAIHTELEDAAEASLVCEIVEAPAMSAGDVPITIIKEQPSDTYDASSCEYSDHLDQPYMEYTQPCGAPVVPLQCTLKGPMQLSSALDDHRTQEAAEDLPKLGVLPVKGDTVRPDPDPDPPDLSFTPDTSPLLVMSTMPGDSVPSPTLKEHPVSFTFDIQTAKHGCTFIKQGPNGGEGDLTFAGQKPWEKYRESFSCHTSDFIVAHASALIAAVMPALDISADVWSFLFMVAFLMNTMLALLLSMRSEIIYLQLVWDPGTYDCLYAPCYTCIWLI